MSATCLTPIFSLVLAVAAAFSAAIVRAELPAEEFPDVVIEEAGADGVNKIPD